MAHAVAAGAVDLRPGGPDPGVTGPRVVSGPDDLVELRIVVESITGPGTWTPPPVTGGHRFRATLPLDRPAPAVALVAAMEGLVDDRTGMWRTWRTTLELVAAALDEVDALVLTLDAVVLDDVVLDPVTPDAVT